MVGNLFSLLDFFGITPDGNGNVTFLGFLGPKAQVEFRSALTMTGVALGLSILSEVFDVYIPKRRLEGFRALYLDEQRSKWVVQLGQQVRVNVMFVHRPVYVLFVARRLRWVWHDGYRPPNHEGVNLCFWSWQGLCGRALRREKAQFVDLRATPLRVGVLFDNFKMGPFKRRRTASLKAVLSVPIFESRGGDAPGWRCIGVFNLDAVEEAGADLLAKNWHDLAQYFTDLGMVVAKLRS